MRSMLNEMVKAREEKIDQIEDTNANVDMSRMMLIRNFISQVRFVVESSCLVSYCFFSIAKVGSLALQASS